MRVGACRRGLGLLGGDGAIEGLSEMGGDDDPTFFEGFFGGDFHFEEAFLERRGRE